MIADIKSKMLYKKIISNKGIFPKLHLNCDTFFNKIGLIVAENCNFPCCLNFLFLFFGC